MKTDRLLLLIIIIIIMLSLGEIIRLSTLNTCPKPYIEYRYVPRTFKEEQEEKVPLEDIFNKLFAYPSPWMISRGIGITDRRDTGLKGREFKV